MMRQTRILAAREIAARARVLIETMGLRLDFIGLDHQRNAEAFYVAWWSEEPIALEHILVIHQEANPPAFRATLQAVA